MIHLQKEFPDNEVVLMQCLAVIDNVQSILPNDSPVIIEPLQTAVLSGPFDLAQNSTMCALLIKFIYALWKVYKVQLSASCDMDGLAQVLNRALASDSCQTRTVAFGVAGDTLQGLLSNLSENQLQNLSDKGVFKSLRALLRYPAEMSLITLTQIIPNLAIFTKVSHCTDELLAEGFAGTVLQCADMIWSDSRMQDCICEILSVHCKNRQFCEELLNHNFLLKAANRLQQGCNHASLFSLINAINTTIPYIFPKMCLEDKMFVKSILGILNPDTSAAIDDIKDACKLLHNVITHAPEPPKLLKYNIIKMMEDCATKWPLECTEWTCKAITVVAQCFIPCKNLKENSPNIQILDRNMSEIANAFFKDKHYLFLKDRLLDPRLCCEPDLLSIMYIALHNIIVTSPDDVHQDLYSPEFIEFFNYIFIRDTTLFPEKVTDIIQCSCAFIYTASCNKEISGFQQANFHTAVVNLLQKEHTTATRRDVSNLLECLAAQYKEYLLDLSPLMKCNATVVALDVLKFIDCKNGEDQSCASLLASFLWTMTCDTHVCNEMYTTGQMHTLVKLVQRVEYSPDIYTMLVTSIGSMAFPEYERKKALTDLNFHLTLLEGIRGIASTSPLNTNSLCCCIATLNDIVCNHLVGDMLIADDCVSTVMNILDISKDQTRVLFDPCLDLLRTLTSALLVQKKHSIIYRLLNILLDILRDSTQMTPSGIGIATSIILMCQEDNEIVVKLGELDATKPLIEILSLKGIGFVTHRYCAAAIDRQFLYLLPTKHPIQNAKKSMDPISTQTNIENVSHNLVPNIPKAPKLNDVSKQQLTSLGINLGEPLLRIGRVYGAKVEGCYPCHQKEMREVIGVRYQGLTCHQYQALIEKGWSRMGGVKLYRSSSFHDVQCAIWETKVSVHEFDYHAHKSYVKVMKRMPVDRLAIETLPAHYCKESYDLYNKYNLERHEWPPVSTKEYCEYAVDSPITNETVNGIEYGSFHQLYRLDGKLVAVSLIDIVPKGIVSLYVWYSPEKEVSKYSLGVYSALKEIEFVRELSKKNPEMKYYYLQGWNENNKKLAYKAKYSPESFYCACITPEWLPSLEAVKEAKEKYLREHTHDQNGLPSSNATTSIAMETTDKDKKVSPGVPCSAFENDRAKYQQLTGHRPDVSKMVVCLNETTYVCLGTMFSLFDMNQSQQDVMKKRLEEILVSIDSSMVHKVVVDLKTHAVTCHL